MNTNGDDMISTNHSKISRPIAERVAALYRHIITGGSAAGQNSVGDGIIVAALIRVPGNGRSCDRDIIAVLINAQAIPCAANLLAAPATDHVTVGVGCLRTGGTPSVSPVTFHAVLYSEELIRTGQGCAHLDCHGAVGESRTSECPRSGSVSIATLIGICRARRVGTQGRTCVSQVRNVLEAV
jgi:hypothetical protein